MPYFYRLSDNLWISFPVWKSQWIMQKCYPHFPVLYRLLAAQFPAQTWASRIVARSVPLLPQSSLASESVPEPSSACKGEENHLLPKALSAGHNVCHRKGTMPAVKDPYGVDPAQWHRDHQWIAACQYSRRRYRSHLRLKCRLTW